MLEMIPDMNGPAVQALLLAKIRGESPVEDYSCFGFLDPVEPHLATCPDVQVTDECASWTQCEHDDDLDALWGDVTCPHGFEDYVCVVNVGIPDEVLDLSRRTGLPAYERKTGKRVATI